MTYMYELPVYIRVNLSDAVTQVKVVFIIIIPKKLSMSRAVIFVIILPQEEVIGIGAS